MSASLRIAILLNPFTLSRKGGDHAPKLARELASIGHNVRVFGDRTSLPSSPTTSSSASYAASTGAASSGAESGGAESDPVAAHVPDANAEALVPRRFGPDAVLAYDSLSPAAWLGARTARALSVPLLLVETGSRAERGRLARVGRGALEMLWGRYVRHTANTLVALDTIAKARALVGGFPEERVVVVAPGVDPGEYRPGLASGLIQRHRIRGRILLYVGRIEKSRGLDVLVQAFARTVGQRDDWSLVLVGEGNGRPELRALIDRLGIGSRVHWLGRVRDEELPGLFSASTLLGVPALDDTVRGSNVARAMACGLPVIASDRAILRGLVEHEACGLLVPAGDLAAWTDALRRASMSPDARRRWGRRGREIAESRLSWLRVARTFESLILRASGEVSEAPLDGDALLVEGAQAASPFARDGGIVGAERSA